MQQIVRTEDREEFGLSRRDIFGLNIFSANGVAPAAAEDDPRVVFLRELSARHASSAHTGNLNDLADSPEELFGHLAAGADSSVQVSVNGGTFYDAAQWPTFPACFFPAVTNQFWYSRTPDGEADIRDLLRLDALALYVEPEDGDSDKIRPRLSRPFVGPGEWIQTVAGIYRLIMLTGADGWYFTGYARDPRHFDMLASALDEAINAIERNSWYRRHAASLVWDDEYEGCLMLPELIRTNTPASQP
jgi:hypothetical protein